jgi:Protein of unknown function (DUF4232)
MKTPARIVSAISTLVLAGSLAAASTTASGTDSASPGHQLAACHGQQLKVRLGGLDAAAGSTYQRIRFTNVSGRRCALHGFPAVTFRGKHGYRIGWPAKRVSRPAHTFVLRSGRTAKTSLQIPNWRNFPVSDCHAKGSPRLRVVPPGTHREVGFRYPAKTCTTKQGRSLIRPVHRVH